jgi:hypothetical protein
MNLQLQESSIASLLQSTGVQQATGRVRSASLLTEMTLIGFVAYIPFRISVDLNDHLIVTPYLIRFEKDNTPIPVCRYAKKAAGQKYKLDNHLLIDPMMDVIPDMILRYNQVSRPLTGEVLLRLMHKNWDKKDFFEKLNDGSYNYVAREKQIELTGLAGTLTCITDDFLCLCSYMNNVTGMPSYTLLSSFDTIRILNED